MLLRHLLAGLCLYGMGAEAQTTSTTSTRRMITTRTTSLSSSSTTSSTPAAASTHEIAVGPDGFKFRPNNLSAKKGDTILFRFYPGGHGVARSDFNFPCIPYELTGVNHIGFFSKIQSPHVVSNDLPTFSVKINDTQPIFFYCPAPGSCVDHHMIGVINPNATHTLEKQEEAVKKASLQLTPGDAWPSETARPKTPGAEGQQQQQQGQAAALGPGQIVGIAIGGAAFLVLAGALLFICGRRSGRGLLPWSRGEKGSATSSPPTPRFGEGSTPLSTNAAPVDGKHQHQHQHSGGPFSTPSHSPFTAALSPYSVAATVVGHDPYRAAGVAAPSHMHHAYHPQHYQGVAGSVHQGGRTPPFGPGSFGAYQPFQGHGQQQQHMPQHGMGIRPAPSHWAQVPAVHGAAYIPPPPPAPVELSAAPRSPAFRAYKEARPFSFYSSAGRGFTPGARQ